MIGSGHFSDRFYDEAVALLKRVCVIPAPSHHEEKRAAFILDYLASQGISDAYCDSAKNVIIPYLVDGSDEYDVYAAHTDVVFPDTEELPMTVEGTELHCPGCADDSANFAALLMYAIYFKKEKPPARRSILFVCNSCEEGLGNLYGIKTLFESFAGRIRTFTSFDSVLGRGIVTTAVGSERYRITVRTEGGHSFADFGKKNAIALLSNVITKLYGQKVKGRYTTYNVGTVEGGTSVNSIAQEACCTYEFRAVSASELNLMRSNMDAVISSVRARGIDISTECIGIRPCGISTDLSPLLTKAEQLMKKYGLSACHGLSSTDCNIPLSIGIPAVCFGLIYAQGMHTRQEHADLSSYRTGLDLGYDYICAVSVADWEF